VALDVINFSNEENVPKLEALINTCNNSGNSHFVDVPKGCAMITDVLFGSPMLNDNEGGAPGVPSNQFAEFGGQDPNMDPEMAQALKMSMEEEAARNAKNKEEAPQPKNDVQMTEAPAEDDEEEHDEEYYLQQAIKMSLAGGAEEETPLLADDSKKEPVQEPAADEKKTDLKDIMTTDFLKELVDDMDLDMNKE